MTPVNHPASSPHLPWALVTGARGFVGRHLTASLQRAGLPVCSLGLTSPGTGDRAAKDDPRFPGAICLHTPEGDVAHIEMDLADAAGLVSVLDRLRPATVYHLAAQSSAAVSFREPAATLQTNVLGTLNLLEAVRQMPVTDRPAVLMVGSAEEYGPQPADAYPLREDTTLQPISPYGVSKAAQTLLGRQYVRSYDLPLVMTRSFSHIGPGQDTRFVFPAFAQQIAAAERGSGPALVKVGNLDAVRDFLDVRDVVTAYRALIKEGTPGEVYHVCSGKGLTIRQGLDLLLAQAKCPITVESDAARMRPSDVPILVGDNTKIRSCTGWEPEWNIDDSLTDILNLARKETT